MWFTSLSGKRQRSASSGRSQGSVRKRPGSRPQLEVLEDRTVPSGTYIFTTIDDPNGPSSSVAFGISSRGDVVGNYQQPSGPQHGFLLSGGQYTNIDDPAGAGISDANGINAPGQIVGDFVDASGAQHGFLLSGGHYTTLDDPNGVGSTVAKGINARGQIVGYYTDARDSTVQHGFLLSGGKYTTLDDPNAVGGGFTVANGINAHGQIVGSYADAKGAQHGFVLSGGQYTTLDAPNALFTAALGINAREQIVGYYADTNANGALHGFLLSGGQYTTLDDPNAVGLTVVNGINDSGKMVGQYDDANGGVHAFLATKAHGDDAFAGPGLAAGRASSGSAQLLLPTAVLANATRTVNQVINVAGGSGANDTDGLSGISTGGRLHAVSAAGKDTALTSTDVFARSDDVFRVDLFSWPDGIDYQSPSVAGGGAFRHKG